MNVTSVQPNLFSLARRYVAAGLSVVPPKQDGSKRPYPDSWKPYQVRCASEMELRRWYNSGLTGVGAVCGEISGNLELFEFDCFDTYIAFGELATQAGLSSLVQRVRDGYSERTPGGGVHWYYRCDEIAGNTKLALKPKEEHEKEHEHDNWKVLIETRGEGGYSVMAPSCGAVHPSGKPYEVIAGRVEDIVRITANERQALWELAKSFDEQPERYVHEPARATPASDRPGDLFNARMSWAEILEPAGWKRVYSRGQTTYWRRPGKSVGISASTNHTGHDTLMVFSTSTPFDITPASYTKFAAYAVINHGGDFTAAGRALWTDGFREERKEAHGTIDWTRETVDPETGEVIEQPLLTGRAFVGQAIREGIPPPVWLVEDILVRGRIHMLYGEPESGKTILLVAWIWHLIQQKQHVVFVDEESGLGSIAAFLRDMKADADALDTYLHYFPFPGLDKSSYAALLNYVDDVQPALVAFDSLTDMLATAGLDENSGVEVTGWMLNVAQAIARRDYAPGVVMIDHVAKDTMNTKYSVGSRAKKAKSDVLWWVEKQDEFDQTKTASVDIHRHKNRPGVLPRSVRFVVGGREGQLVVERFDVSQHVVSALTTEAQGILDYLREDAPAGASNGEIQAALGIGHSTVVKYVNELIKHGLVEKEGFNKSTIYVPIDRPRMVDDRPRTVPSPEAPPSEAGGLPPLGGTPSRTVGQEGGRSQEEDDIGWD